MHHPESSNSKQLGLRHGCEAGVDKLAVNSAAVGFGSGTTFVWNINNFSGCMRHTPPTKYVPTGIEPRTFQWKRVAGYASSITMMYEWEKQFPFFSQGSLITDYYSCSPSGR
jgi:hypothetical protein